MTTITDSPGTNGSIEVVDASDLLRPPTPAEPASPRQPVVDTDRGLQLIRSHQRQRDIRRQAMGWD